MEKTPKPGLALAAIAPAVMVPILLPTLTRMGVPDDAKGIIIGVLLGISLLLIALAARNLLAARSASGKAAMEPDATGNDV